MEKCCDKKPFLCNTALILTGGNKIMECNRNVTMAVAKSDFYRGFLASFAIDRLPLGEGWAVRLSYVQNKEWAVLVDARVFCPRRFRTLDAAISAVEAVGFEVRSLSA